MRIAFITHQFPPSIGGMQQWNRQMAESYSRAGHAVTVFHLRWGARPHASQHYTYVPVTVDPSVNVESCPGERYSPATVARILGFYIRHGRRLLRQDVWQITFGELLLARTVAACLARLCGKTLVAVSGCVVFRQPYNHPLRRTMALACQRFVLRGARLVLVDGQDLRREFVLEGIDDRRIRTCYAGVDTEVFSPRPDSGKFRALLEERDVRLVPGVKTVLYCSRFSHENAPLDFLAAVDRVTGVQAIMVGDGPLLEAVRSRARTFAVPVHLPGSLPYESLPLVYSTVDVCLYTFSRHIGGISQVIPLSMSCAAAVITTDIGDNRALVADGTNGFLVGEGDHAAMAQRVRDVVEGLVDSRAIGSAARSAIVDGWGIDRRHEEYRRLLDDLSSGVR